MAKIGFLRPWWLWLGALAALGSVLVILTNDDGDPWMGAAMIGIATFGGGVLIRLMHAAQPVPKPLEIAWDDPALYVGVAFGIAGFVIGLTVSERWTTRGDYTLVAVIASVWTPTVIAVMRRFRSRAGHRAACTGAWTATVIPLSRALPRSLLGVSSPVVVGFTAGFLMLLVLWALNVGREPRAAAENPALPN